MLYEKCKWLITRQTVDNCPRSTLKWHSPRHPYMKEGRGGNRRLKAHQAEHSHQDLPCPGGATSSQLQDEKRRVGACTYTCIHAGVRVGKPLFLCFIDLSGKLSSQLKPRREFERALAPASSLPDSVCELQPHSTV